MMFDAGDRLRYQTPSLLTPLAPVTSNRMLLSRSHARSDSGVRLATPSAHAFVHTIISTPLANTWYLRQSVVPRSKSTQHGGP